MQKEIESLKKRLKSLEGVLQQNKIDWDTEKGKQAEKLKTKEKEASLLKSEVQQINELLSQVFLNFIIF
jgi:hypothetical protein